MKTRNLILLAAFIWVALSAFAPNAKNEYKANKEESKIEWLGKKVTGEHNGHITLKDGTLEMEDGKLVGGEFVIDMTSITNEDLKDEEYNAKLVGHLKSDDFFGVETYPTASFVITEVSQKSNTKYDIKGDLTIKGKTHAIEFPAEIVMLDDQVVSTATIIIDRSKYDVKYGSGSFFDGLGDKMIYDDFELSVRLVANK
ncbi:MAG TPA: lipid-binding protein [Cytophagales bacterium]|jgi:polyisoprenoid-binding protein YceI|nr:lipid-binding protein [Cytophagales bacterium]